jgi:hypothetical protein
MSHRRTIVLLVATITLVAIAACFVLFIKRDSSATPWAKVIITGEAEHGFSGMMTGQISVEGPLPFRKALKTGPDGKSTAQDGVLAWVMLTLDDKTKVQVFLDVEKEKAQGLFESITPSRENAKKTIVVEGSLARPQTDNPFASFVAVGEVRILTENEAGQFPAKGSARIEGKTLPGKYDLEDGSHSQLAIENGTSPIIIRGKLAEEYAKVKGTIRLSGKLYVGKKGTIVLDADKGEILDKK